MSKTFLMTVVAIAVCLASTTIASHGGESWTYAVEAKGKNEVPPVNSQAKAFFRISASSNSLNGEVVILGIKEFTQAHLHIGAKGTNGPVAFFVWNLDSKTVTKQPLTGSFFFKWSVTPQDFMASAAAADYSAFLYQLNAGNVYFNVHTTKNAGGELRGQVQKYDKSREPSWSKHS